MLMAFASNLDNVAENTDATAEVAQSSQAVDAEEDDEAAWEYLEPFNLLAKVPSHKKN